MKNVALISFILLFLFTGLLAGPGAEVGEKAPDFKLKSLTGNNQVSLAGLRGKVVLLDFWASWCAPCKISMPHLTKLSAKYKKFEVIAINIDDDKENAITFLSDLNLDINAVYDETKKVVSAYDVPEMPTAFLIDQYGTVQYIHSGYSEEKMKKLEFAIRGLLDKR